MGVTKYVEDLIISSKTTANTVGATSVLGANMGSTLNGEVYVVDSSTGANDGQVLNSAAFDAAGMTAFTIVPIIADGKARGQQTKINKADVLKVTRELYAAPVTKVVTLGYNGTTGDLALSKGTAGTNEYALVSRIINDTTFQDLFKQYIMSYPTTAFAATTPTNQEKMDYFYQYLAEWNGTSNTINTRLFRDGTENIFKYTDLTLTYSTTGLTASGSATTVTNGSNKVASTGHGLTAGAYVRLGVTSTTVTTNGIYKVDTVTDANNYTITTAYKGVTSTSATSAAVVTFGATPAFGFTITVKPNATPYTIEGGVQTFNFDANYSRQDDNISSTLIDQAALKTVTESKMSSGHSDSVKDAEFKHLTIDGVITRYDWGNLTPPTKVTAATYDLYTIAYRDTNVLSDQTTVRNTKTVSAFFPAGSTASGDFYAIIDGLGAIVQL
jgi:hypothetical protein